MLANGHPSVTSPTSAKSCVTSLHRNTNVKLMYVFTLVRSGADFSILDNIHVWHDSSVSASWSCGIFGKKFTSPFLAFLMLAASGDASGLLHFDLFPPLNCTSSHLSLLIFVQKFPILKSRACGQASHPFAAVVHCKDGCLSTSDFAAC